MPWVKVISEVEAAGDLITAYQEFGKKDKTSGERRLLPHLAVFTQNPPAFMAFAKLEKILRFEASELSRRQREMIATVVSRLNGCVHCAVSHAQKVLKLSRDERLYENLGMLFL